MSTIPTPSIVKLVAHLIRETFVVDEEEAGREAFGLVAHAEGWGGVGAAPPDWAQEVKIRFGERLKWRSEAARERFFAEKKTTYVAYENYIRARK